MKAFFSKLKKCKENREDVVLVAVIASSGSTPRGAGARMIIGKQGLIAGTIGGGAVEYKSQQIAADVLNQKQSIMREFKLTRNEVADLGMICGGDVVVYFQYVAADSLLMAEMLDVILRLCDKNEDSWLITDISDEASWNMGVYSASSGLIGSDIKTESLIPFLSCNAARITLHGRKFYVEPLICAGRIYIFGGGHVAQELVPVLAHVGFRCVVLDDRTAFANKSLFPQAEQSVVGDFNDIGKSVTIEARDYVVIMTRGHQYDYTVQSQALKTDACYIGVIGSREKIAQTTRKLMTDGFTETDINRIYTPIGLAIKAETPAEIAISITAELIKVRAEQSKR